MICTEPEMMLLSGWVYIGMYTPNMWLAQPQENFKFSHTPQFIILPLRRLLEEAMNDVQGEICANYDLQGVISVTNMQLARRNDGSWQYHGKQTKSVSRSCASRVRNYLTGIELKRLSSS